MLKTALFTGVSLIAFAANSVLCRLALGGQTIDAASFTMVRLLSGALMLYTLVRFLPKVSQATTTTITKGSWLASVMLFTYAIAFSYAYVSLDTGTGALVLFGTIQITMVLMGIWRGHKLVLWEWLGLLLACLGFAYLMLPDVNTPSWIGFFLMLISGVAWSVYTFQGYASSSPLMDTAYNFIRTIPLVCVLFLFTANTVEYSVQGVLLAVASGAMASGLGYTLWYMALAGIASTQAAVLQLLVPMLAAMGGVLFVAEPLTSRLIISTVVILSGVLLVILKRNKT